MSESQLQSDIITALCLHERVAWAMAVTTGKVKVKGGYATLGHYITEDMKRKVGMSDIIGQLKDGRIFTIEVKPEGKEPTTEQYEFMNLVKRNNGISGWATSISEAYEIINLEEMRDGKV